MTLEIVSKCMPLVIKGSEKEKLATKKNEGKRREEGVYIILLHP